MVFALLLIFALVLLAPLLHRAAGSMTGWLLAIALACALLELLVRGRSEPEAA
jgi:hypothetical protein